MEMLMYCENSEARLSISYNHWNQFRLFILHSTLHYVKENIQSDKTISLFLSEAKQNIVQDFLLLFQTTNKKIDYLSQVNQFFHSSSEHLNAFISIDCQGLYALCYKTDKDGMYSVGNAMDILILFQTIRSFFSIDSMIYSNLSDSDDSIKKEYSDDIQSTYLIFTEILTISIETKTNISFN